MKIETLYIVTRAERHSTLADVCFATDARGLALQFAGGLTPDEIVAMFTEEKEAVAHARRLLDRRDTDYDAAPCCSAVATGSSGCAPDCYNGGTK